MKCKFTIYSLIEILHKIEYLLVILKMRLIISSLKKYSVVMVMITSSCYFSYSQDTHQNVKAINDKCLLEAYDLTRNCVGFSAPVSGRAFAYLSVIMYETSVPFIAELKSVTKQFSDFNMSESINDDLSHLSWELVVISSNIKALNYYYRNMPPASKQRLMTLEQQLKEAYVTGVSANSKLKSIQFGEAIATQIIDWSKSDGGDIGFEENFPETFSPKECISCWTKTTPGYLPALLPYWGENRTILAGVKEVSNACVVTEFSKDSSSLLFKDAMSLYLNAKDNNPEYETIAEFWDDSPGYSGTPVGHFFMLALNQTIVEEFSLTESLEMNLKMGIAINDAIISSWYLKYKYNFIRPITYIQRYIDPQFNSRIPSPPFPEFPSGHSFQSGAATTILSEFRKSGALIIDSTNWNREDIIGTPRKFDSYHSLGEEASKSRFYGGIHFDETLRISLLYGRKIGAYVNSTLECR